MSSETRIDAPASTPPGTEAGAAASTPAVPAQGTTPLQTPLAALNRTRIAATAAGTRRPGSPRQPEAPRLRQLMGVCGWAAVLGGIGLIIGLRGHIGILAGEPPTWYEPSFIIVGVIGILLTVGAFLTVHRRRAPWILLGTSSVALIVAMSLTSTAF